MNLLAFRFEVLGHLLVAVVLSHRPQRPVQLIELLLEELLLFGNPSSARHRANFSVHASRDGGLSWPESVVVYPGGAAYSDMSFTSSGDLVVLFEKDDYNTIA